MFSQQSFWLFFSLKRDVMKTKNYSLALASIFCLVIALTLLPSICKSDTKKTNLQNNHNNFEKIFISSQNENKLSTLSKKFKSDTLTAKDFLEKHESYFGLKNADKELKFIKKRKDSLGMNHLRYNQNYQDIPIFGAQIIVHLEKDFSVSSANGKIIPAIPLNVRPDISEDEATIIAKEEYKKKYGSDAIEIKKINLYILNKKIVDENEKDGESYLTWQVELRGSESKKLNSKVFFFIDAHSGKLIYQIQGIKTAINRRIYDGSSGSYVLNRSEGDPVQGIADADNLYDILGNVHSYYSTKFSRDGANELDGLGDGTAEHPSINTDGYANIDLLEDPNDCPNAYFDGNSVLFCQGMVSLDNVGHEYTHGIDYFSIKDSHGNPFGLVYTRESGALSEAFADIFGEAVENYSQGSSDWIAGEGTFPPFRSLKNPTSDGYPDKFHSSNYYCGGTDYGGVHNNSSVLSHAAYIMAEGKSFNGCQISGIGKDAEEKILYRALSYYLIPSSNFSGAYNAINSACGDLYGATSTTCREAKKALQSVEMNQGGKCSSQAEIEPGCVPPTISSITSDKDSGTYHTGDIIDIRVNFSENVTSQGEVIVTLETGDLDRTCSFTINNSTQGLCSYTIQAGDSSSNLNVSGVSGNIFDADGNTMSNFTVGSNLSITKSISIDSSFLTETPASFLTDTPTLVYSKKKSVHKRVRITVYSLALKSKKGVRVRLNNRRASLIKVKNQGSSSLLTLNIKYRKWARGNYNLILRFKNGNASFSSVLSII